MNPRQRRGVALLILAGAGALGVFATVVVYVGNVQRTVGPLVDVLMVKANIAAYTPINGSTVKPAQMPARWVPPTALHNLADAAGFVAASPLKEGSLLQADMLQPAPDLKSGQREVAILVDAETGVAGKIRQGSVVDIYATFTGKNNIPDSSSIIVSGARILDIGGLENVNNAQSSQQVVPVTFALSVRDSLVLTYAESFAAKVRLGLLAPGDTLTVPLPQRTYILGQ